MHNQQLEKVKYQFDITIDGFLTFYKLVDFPFPDYHFQYQLLNMLKLSDYIIFGNG